MKEEKMKRGRVRQKEREREREREERFDNSPQLSENFAQSVSRFA